MAKDSTGTAASATAELCGNCGLVPHATGHRWCNKCKAEAQKTYDAERESGLEERGFRKGCEAMRDQILKGFRMAHPAGLLKAGEVMNYVIETKPPDFGKIEDVKIP